MKVRKLIVSVMAVLVLLGAAFTTAMAEGLEIGAGACAGDETVATSGGSISHPGYTIPLPGQRAEVEQFSVRLGDRTVTVPGFQVETPTQLTVPAVQVEWEGRTYYIPKHCLEHRTEIEGSVQTPGAEATIPSGSVQTPGASYGGEPYTIDLDHASVTVPGPSASVPPGEFSWDEQTITVPEQEVRVPDETIEIEIDLSGKL